MRKLEDGTANGEQDFRRAALECLDGLYGFALSLCRDAAQAQDLVQETYARALAARQRASPGENLRGWLFTILHNVWRNECRRRYPDAPGVSEPDFDGWPSRADDPERVLQRREAREHIRAAIDELPDAFREVVLLRCVEGFSYRQMAEILACPAGTVMSRLARARALLRRSVGLRAVEPRRAGGEP